MNRAGCYTVRAFRELVGIQEISNYSGVPKKTLERWLVVSGDNGPERTEVDYGQDMRYWDSVANWLWDAHGYNVSYRYPTTEQIHGINRQIDLANAEREFPW